MAAVDGAVRLRAWAHCGDNAATAMGVIIWTLARQMR